MRKRFYTITAKRLLVKINTMIENEIISNDSKILFVNDGSKDKTWSIIEELHNQNNIFSGVNLSRNRGHQNALLAGLMTAKEYCRYDHIPRCRFTR